MPTRTNSNRGKTTRKMGLITSHKLTSLLTLAAVFLILGLIAWLATPNSYTLSGRVINNLNNPVENIQIISNGSTAKTNKKGEFQLSNLKKGDNIAINQPEEYDYTTPKITLDYDSSEMSSIKNFKINQDIELRYNVKDFSNQLLTNEKYTKHNMIWSDLDKSSQDIFKTKDAYESYFKVIFNKMYPEEKMKSFSIDEKEITIRQTWTSPQGEKYKDVYEVPYEYTDLSGISNNDILYVIPFGNELRTTTAYTSEIYMNMLDVLKEEGYLNN